MPFVARTTAANEFSDIPAVKSLMKGMPADVASFIVRTAECSHWAGEEPYDQERARYIRSAVQRAGCGRLESLEKRLRKKYRNNAQVLENIESAKHLAL